MVGSYGVDSVSIGTASEANSSSAIGDTIVLMMVELLGLMLARRSRSQGTPPRRMSLMVSPVAETKLSSFKA